MQAAPRNSSGGRRLASPLKITQPASLSPAAPWSAPWLRGFHDVGRGRGATPRVLAAGGLAELRVPPRAGVAHVRPKGLLQACALARMRIAPHGFD